MLYVYIHICTINNWEEVVTNLYNKLCCSGLLDKIDELRVSIVGTEKKRVLEILNTPKTRIVFFSTDTSLYERPCLEAMRRDAEREQFKALYIHSKGIRTKNSQHFACISDWIELMCYFLIGGWKKCVEQLDKHSAVGINILRANRELSAKQMTNKNTSNSHHFSGNFWWANSSYILTLPVRVGELYLDPEVWIGSGTGTLLSLHQSTCRNHYFERYPPEKYINRQRQQVFSVKNLINTHVKPVSLPVKPVGNSIYIYFHVCTKGRWKNVTQKLFNKLKSTGLLDAVKKVYVTILGDHISEAMEILNHPKIEVIHVSRDATVYERACLTKLYDRALVENFQVLYIHSKGLSQRSINTVDDWVDLMIYFNIEQWRRCVKLLDTHDTCGVNLQRASYTAMQYSSSTKDISKTEHYSGNFWWANSEYIRKLSPTIGKKYLDPEFWIGTAEKRNMASLWKSGVNHYTTPYPRKLYIGQ